MDHIKVAEELAEAIAAGSKPLTSAQRSALRKAIVKPLEAARQDGLNHAKNMAAHCQQNGINYP